MSTPKIHDFATLSARVSEMQKSGSGSPINEPDSVHNVTHPSVPSHPDGDSDAKKHLPPSGTNTAAGTSIATAVTKPSGVGENVDNKGTTVPAIDPNPDFNTDKLASNAATLAANAAALLKKADATAPAAAAPAAAAPAKKVEPAAAPVPGAAAPAKTASEIDGSITFDDSFIRKLGSVILEDAEGVKLAHAILVRRKGIEEANALIKNAAEAHRNFLQLEEEQEAFAKLASTAEYQEALAIRNAIEQADPATRARIVKFASAHQRGSANLNHPMLKLAYQQGAEDAEAGLESMGGAEDPAAMSGEMALPGATDPGAQASVEELKQAIEMLVQSGEIDEATAAQVIAQLEGGAGGDPAAAGPADASMPPEGAMPEEAMAAEVAKQANAILGAFDKQSAAA